MSNKGLALLLVLFWVAPPLVRADVFQPRLGGFLQSGGGALGSGGLFYAPFETAPSALAGRLYGGAWLMKDQAGTPALAPTLEAEGLWTAANGNGPWFVGLTAGAGFALVLDAPFGVLGARVGRDFGSRGLPLLGANALSVQSQLLISPQGATFIGMALDWRW